MPVVIINGKGGSGKNTFCTLCNRVSRSECVIYTTIVQVRRAARALGWDGSKSLEGRKFLSDLKNFSLQHNDYLFKRTCENIDELLGLRGIKVVFVMCREPQEIERLREKYNAYTLLISSERTEANKYGNPADDNVNDYVYDYYITNNGTEADLQSRAEWFLNEIGVEISDSKN